MDETRKPFGSVMLLPLLMLGGLLLYQNFSGGENPFSPSAPAKKGVKAERNPPPLAAAKAPAQPKPSEQLYRLETPEFRALISSYNTGLRSYRLQNEQFRELKGGGKELVTTERERYLPLRVEVDGVALPEAAEWKIDPSAASSAQAGDARSLRFVWEGDGVRIQRTLQVGKGPYQLWSTLHITNLGKSKRTLRVRMGTYHYVPRKSEEGGFFASRSPAISQGLCRHGEDTVRKERKDLMAKHGYGPKVQFVGIENAYFANLVAATDKPAARCQLQSSERGGTAKEPDGSLFESVLLYPYVTLEPGSAQTFRSLAYVGPKDLDALKAAGHHLPKAVDLGFFSWIAEYLVRLLRLIQSLVGNWGLAIILLTVLVKLVLYPLTEKSFQSMARMRALKPEMDRLNELYKDDREKKGAAMMELYRKHKINPLGGCLPSLLQLPVWFALYASLSTNVELYHAPFTLWWGDLSSPDPYFVLPLFLGVLMFFQQKMTPTTMDPAQAKVMLYLMPVMITAFMLFLPAGLCLYMVTNSALSMAQQKFIHYRVERLGAVASPEASSSAGDSSATGGSSRESAKLASRPKVGQHRRHRRGRA